MKCTKCGRLDPRGCMGKCLDCHGSDQATELEQLRRQNESLRERVRDLERENFRLQDRG